MSLRQNRLSGETAASPRSHRPMNTHPLPIVCLLFATAALGGCGSTAESNADEEALGQDEQAFSEPNCINADPNSGGSFFGFMFPRVDVAAPYTNPKCGASWAAYVARAT